MSAIRTMQVTEIFNESARSAPGLEVLTRSALFKGLMEVMG